MAASEQARQRIETRNSKFDIKEAIRGWGPVAARAVFYGSVSCSLGLITPNRSVSQWCMRQWCIRCSDGLDIDRVVDGLEHVSADKQYVYVANHQSMLDILLLGTVIPGDYRWLAKELLFKVPFMGWHLSLTGHVPVYRGRNKKRNKELPLRVHQVITEGASLLFFPEGTRVADGSLRPFKIGAFMSAVKEGLPIAPVVLAGTGDLLEPGAPNLVPGDDRHCAISFLPPISVPNGGTEKERAQALMNATYAAMNKRLLMLQEQRAAM